MCRDPLLLPESRLQMHFVAIDETLKRQVDASATPRVSVDWTSGAVVAGLAGAGCERVSRNRGASTYVAPLMCLNSALWAWVGYKEEWSPEPPAGQTKRFSFKSAGITIYLGLRASLQKPQLFRAEWAGWAKWDGTSYGYQAGDAAHPHWQFDVLDSLKRDEVAERAATYLAVLKEEHYANDLEEFVPNGLGEEEVYDLVSTSNISRIHFASAAAWWRVKPDDAHAHAPTEASEIQVWLDRTLSYVTTELCRI